MTNEETIKTLKKLKSLYNGSYGTVIDEAIKALEQESITWIVGKDNCQVAVRNMPIDKMKKICAVIGEEEQQPCEDCVSRQAVIDAIDNIDWYHISNKGELVQGANKQTMPLYKAADIFYAIDALPSVTPQQPRWIPVSERLPEEDGFYLATCDGEICGEDEPIVSMAEFENGKWADDEDDYQCVLAWMPLPSSYQGE